MKVAVLFALLCAFAAGFAVAQQSVLLDPLNTGVNALLQAAGTGNSGASRVVPVETQSGAPAGYAQVVGSPDGVNATKAVVELQTQFGGSWSIDALVPVTSVKPGSSAIHRARGVAVDAVINAHF